ncbi:MAG: hypothetical protein ACREX3_19930, partial [Gammaproteobacteria bacterium]
MNERRPSAQQVKMLSEITHPLQKKLLLAAIHRGDEIPESAWQPITSENTEKYGQTFDSKTIEWVHRYWLAMVFEELFCVLLESRNTANEASRFLCAPIVNKCEMTVLALRAGMSQMFTELCKWGYFNPMGPTALTLALVSIQDDNDNPLLLDISHPSSPSHAVLGLLPVNASRDANRLAWTLEPLFKTGGPSEFPFLFAPPTY